MLDINQIEVNDILIDSNKDRFKVMAIDTHGAVIFNTGKKKDLFGFLTWKDIKRSLVEIRKGK